MAGINWRDAKTNPPTGEDLEKGWGVTVFDGLSHCGIRTVTLSQVLSDDKWCRCSEFKTHIESTLNPTDSPWVFAKDRMPTKNDGDFVLWMCDEYERPVVLRIESFGQSVSTKNSNLRWCRIPPCPPSPKRELPAVSPIYDGDDAELARYATLRDGTHVHVLELVGNAVYMVVHQHHRHQIIVNRDGHFLGDKSQHECDIVHVGGWLTAEELEAKRNGN